MTGFTGTLSGDKTQVTATPARKNGGKPGHSTPMTGNIGTLSGDKTQVTANPGASTNQGALDEEMIIDVKITEAQILIHEAEKLFLHNRDTNILSYVLEKKKELGLAQQELLSVKKVKMLLSSTTNTGTGSPNTGPLPLTMSDFSNGNTPNTSRAPLFTSHGLRDSMKTSFDTKIVGTQKLPTIFPPEGFLGINNSTHPAMRNTLSAMAYLGKDTGLNKYYNACKAHFPNGEIPIDTQKLMIHMTQESWEKQRINLIRTYGADKIPDRLEIQYIDTFLGATGKRRFSQMSKYDN
jgi:hypothetical protein